MISLPFGQTDDDDLPDLPEPNVEFAASGIHPDEMTEAGIRGICMNPAYAGIGEFPPLISDKQWVASCKQIMEQETPEQFLVNLLFLLRSTLGYVGESDEG